MPYLFTHFKEKLTPDGEQVYFAVSRDGFNWEQLNGGEPILTAEKGFKGCRDIEIVRLLDGSFSILTTDEGFSKGFTQGYGGIWTMLTAACVFLGLYRVKVGKGTGKALAWLSGGVFEGYLLSKIFDIWTYPLVKQWHTPDKFWLVFLVITMPTFICTLLLGKLVSMAAKGISNRLPWYHKRTKV